MRDLPDGVSDKTLAFAPGLEVKGERVGRTFQPSFVVCGDGTRKNQ